MKILLCCNTMSYMSGSPLYFYTLAMELVKNNDVTLYSDFKGIFIDNSREIMRNNLLNAGVKLIQLKENINDKFDLTFYSQNILPPHNSRKKINIIHY